MKIFFLLTLFATACLSCSTEEVLPAGESDIRREALNDSVSSGPSITIKIQR